MKWSHLISLLLTFSVLFWSDYFLSLGQSELNPLYQSTNKFIFFPVIIISVVMLNKLWGNSKAINVMPRFLIALFAFAFVWNIPVAFAQSVPDQSTYNLGFESTASLDNKFGFTNNFLFGACGDDVKQVDAPTGWLFSTSQSGGGSNSADPIDDKKIITSFTTEGAKSLAMWWIPPAPCELNNSNNNVQNITRGINIKALSPLINVSTNELILKFDSAPLNFYPVKCDSYLCSKKFYGKTCALNTPPVATVVDNIDEAECVNSNGNPEVIDSTMSVKVLYNNVTTIIYQGSGNEGVSIPSQSNFTTKQIDLSQFLPSGVSQIQLQFETYVLSSDETLVKGFLLDNIRFASADVVQSPANDYILDMVNLTDFPSTVAHNIANSVTTITYSKVSRLFDGTALARVGVQRTGGSGCGGSSPPFHTTGTINFVKVWYNDQSFLDMKNYSKYDDHLDTGSADWDANIFFPIIDADDLNRVEISVTGTHSSCPLKTGGSGSTYLFNVTYDSRLSEVRESYDDNLQGTEIVQGYPHMFPVVNFNNRVFSNGSQAYNLYNLAFSIQTPTSDNVFFELRRSDGTLKNIASGIESISPFILVGTGDFTPYALHSQNFQKLWLDSIVPSVGDYVTVYVKDQFLAVGNHTPFNYMSNTSTRFDPLNSTGGICVNVCQGSTLRLAFQSSFGGNVSVCSFTFIQNDESCVVPPAPPQIGSNFGGNLTSPIGGDATQNALNAQGIGWLGVFITPLFFIFLICVGIAGAIEYYVGKVAQTRGVAFLTVFLGMILLVTYLGVFPIEVAILVIIIAGALLVWQVKGMIGGQQGGG